MTTAGGRIRIAVPVRRGRSIRRHIPARWTPGPPVARRSVFRTMRPGLIPQLLTVPGADHDNRLMAPAAVPLLLEGMPKPGPRGEVETEQERLPETLPVTGS